MRTIIAGMVMAAGMALVSIPTATAGPISGAVREAGSGASLLEQAQYRSSSRYCERLRRACTYKEERGEQGEGNCRRYRRECG